MADHSAIEWTDATWNPLRGCARVSDGCRNCYAEKVAARFSGPGMPYEGLIHPSAKGWNGQVRLVPELLRQPWDWVKPRRIFVNSMSDLFHESVPFEFIAAVFWIMSCTTRHTYQVLTKRPARMLEFFEWVKDYADGYFDDDRITDIADEVPAIKALDWKPATARRGGYDNCGPLWPYENVWIGVSVEDQKTADERIPLLLKCPAAVRWLSCEPLLGPTNILGHLMGGRQPGQCANCGQGHGFTRCPNYGGIATTHYAYEGGPILCDKFRRKDFAIDWVVTGGESGAGARPMHPDWARALRDQCARAGVPFFFKQWGEFSLEYDRDRDDPDYRRCGDMSRLPGRWINAAGGHGFHGDRVHYAHQVGKKKAGRLLDGQEHNAYPEVADG